MIQNPTCNGANNGKICAKITAKTLPFTAVLTNITTNTVIGVPSSIPAGGSASPYDTNGQYCWDNLTPGYYILQITDSSEPVCITPVPFQLVEPPIIEVNPEIVAGKCGDDSVTITVTASGGTGVLTYKIENITDVFGPIIQASNTFNNIPPSVNPYTITVTDINGCTKTKDITAAISPNIVFHTGQKNISCCNVKDGEINVVVEDGTGPFRFILTSVDNTYTQSSDCPPSICPVTDEEGNPITTCNTNPCNYTHTFNGLPPGEYNVTVIDVNGCSSTTTTSIILTQPTCIIVSGLVTTGVTCGECCDGSFTITNISGGVPDYEINFVTYPENFIPPTTYFTDGTTPSVFNDLKPGLYTIHIVDSSGCIKELQVGISAPDEHTIVFC